MQYTHNNVGFDRVYNAKITCMAKILHIFKILPKLAIYEKNFIFKILQLILKDKSLMKSYLNTINFKCHSILNAYLNCFNRDGFWT